MMGIGFGGIAAALHVFAGWPGNPLVEWGVPVFAALCIITFASLRAGPTLRALVVVNGIAALLGLLAAEVYFTYEHRSIETATIAQATARKDPRSVLEVVRDMRGTGLPAVPSLYPRAYTSDSVFSDALGLKSGGTLPLGGVANRRTVMCNETGEFELYDSDAFGFNNPPGQWRPPVSVLAVGDSYTQGHCVSSGKSFADLIRAELGTTVNLGMAGNGPIAALAGIAEYAPALRPEKILWFFFEGNDFTDFKRERSVPQLVRYVKDGWTQQLYARRGSWNDRLESAIAAKLRQPPAQIGSPQALSLRQIVLLRALRERFGLALGDNIGTGWKTMEQTIEQAASIASRLGSELVLVLLPGAKQFAAPTALMAYYKKRLLDIATNAGLTIVDLEPTLREQDDWRLLFAVTDGVYHGHYSERGHAIVARETLSRLAEGKSAHAATARVLPQKDRP